MVDRPTVKIKIKPYLKQFLISVYGEEPLYLPKRDKLADRLAWCLNKPPDQIPPPDPEANLEIVLPWFEQVNIHQYNYMSRRGQYAFELFVQQRFWVTFEEFMDLNYRAGLTKYASFMLFLERYNIEEDSSMAQSLYKSLYRSRRISQLWPKRPYNKSKK
jgi:hypothetical protein